MAQMFCSVCKRVCCLTGGLLGGWSILGLVLIFDDVLGETLTTIFSVIASLIILIFAIALIVLGFLCLLRPNRDN